MPQKWMHASDQFGCVEHGSARRDSVRRERFLSRRRDGTLREGMRQRLKLRVVFERQVRALVGFDQREDLRGCG